MLVRLTDTKGRTLWINPVHVKFMREKRSTTEIIMAATWGSAPVAKIADIMAFLIDIESIDEIVDLKKYKPHLMTGDRAGTYSFHVTANWRITFKHDTDINELYDVDYEDYH